MSPRSEPSGRNRSRSDLRDWAVGAASVAAALCAWELLGRSGVYPPHLFPPPSAVARELKSLAASGDLLRDTVASARRWSLGLALGAALGTLMGLLTGVLLPARRVVSPLMNLTRAIPFIVLLPLAMLWFGLGEASKIAIVAWGVFCPVWLSTESAALAVEKEYVWAARTLGAEGWRLWREVHWPCCLPGVVTGLRLAVSTATFALAAAEMSGAFDGLAYRIFYSYQMFQTERMMAGVVALGALAFAVDRLFVAASRRVLPWREEAA
ncbi:MAG: ABC transporter permease [Elusimicrobia bacterium]|nr:ABC transporter permease [Elusimicrobiota bacterium]